MRNIGGELSLQTAVFLQLSNLRRQRFGHLVKAHGQSRHVIFTLHDHAFAQVAVGKALGNLGGGTHWCRHLIGEEPSNTAEKRHDDYCRTGEQTTNQLNSRFLCSHRGDQIELEPINRGRSRATDN